MIFLKSKRDVDTLIDSSCGGEITRTVGDILIDDSSTLKEMRVVIPMGEHGTWEPQMKFSL